MRKHRRHILERHINIATQQRRKRRTTASKRHRRQVGFGQCFEQLARHMNGATHATVTEGHVFFFRRFYELNNAFIGAVCRDHHDVRYVDHVFQENEIFDRVVAEIRIDGSANGVPWRGH